MTTSGLQLLAQHGVERAVNSLPEGLLIAAFAWLLLRIVGKQNSGTRFAILFTALLAIAGIPFAPRMSGAIATVGLGTPGFVTLPSSFALLIFAAWIFVAALTTTRLAIGLWRLGWLRRSCINIATSDLPAVARETVEQFQVQRMVGVCTSPEVRVPTAIGFFKPIILLPGWALKEFSPEQLRIILLHELAHLLRRDDWTNLVQKLVRTIFFFHPAVLWIEKRLSLERELACDNLVLAENASPHAYAECLVSLAEKSFICRRLEMAQAAIGRARDTSLRLMQILDKNRVQPARTARLLGPALAMMTAFAALCLFLLPEFPKLIAFQESPTIESVVAASASPPLPSLLQPPVKTVASPVRSVGDVRPVRHTKAAPDVRREQKFVSVLSRQRRSVGPSVVMARATSQPVAASRTVLLIMQTTTQFDGRGSMTVDFRVWRVTFVNPGRNRTQDPARANLS